MIPALGILGYLLLVLAPLAQIWKSRKENDTREVSLLWPAICVAGMGLLIPQVIATGNTVLIIGHNAAMLTNSLNLIDLFRRRAATRP